MEQELINVLSRIADGIEGLIKRIDERPTSVAGDEILKAVQVAEILGVDNSTINYYKRTGRLPVTKVGCTDYFLKSDVMRVAALQKRKSS